MLKKLKYSKNQNGLYDVTLGTNIVGTTTTVKEARNKIAEIKRNAKRSNLITKLYLYSNNLGVLE